MFPHNFLVYFSNQLCTLRFYVTFNVVQLMFIAFFNFTCVTMMVFNVCVIGTVQLLNISINLLMEDIFWWALIAHVAPIPTVMIDGCQCITIVQNRNQFFKRLVYQQISENEIRFITAKVITVLICFLENCYGNQSCQHYSIKNTGFFFLQCINSVSRKSLTAPLSVWELPEHISGSLINPLI